MEVLRPRSGAEALRLYGRAPHAIPLAGGTDFMVAWNMGLHNHKTILDLSAVKEWSRVTRRKDGIKIGALVTHAKIQQNRELQKYFPLLVRASAVVGAAAIQNRGTIGGNIANASPAGDTFPPLAVYEATVNLVGRPARRSLPFMEVFAGVKKTTLGPAELIESVEIPDLEGRPARQLFQKVGTRAAQALSKVVVAGLLWTQKDGSVRELRFAIGSAAPTVRRLRNVEEFVAGKKLKREVVEEACSLVQKDISPIDDIRSTAEYRLQVSKNLLRCFLDGADIRN